VDSEPVCYFLVDGSKGLLIVPTNTLPFHGRSLFSEDKLVVGTTSQVGW
jgi:hypothetical protein